MPGRHRVRARLSGAVALMAVLAACAPGGGAGDGFLAGLARGKAPATTRLAGGRITVAGPAGFCIDKATRLATDSGGFVVLGQCASISGNPDDARPPVPALLSASVSPLAEASVAAPAALRAYLESPAGRASLARSGQAEQVEILAMQETDNALVVHVRDASPSRPAAISDEYWRAMFVLRGALVSLTVTGLTDLPISGATGRHLLADFRKAMRAANPERAKSGGGLANFFNRLL